LRDNPAQQAASAYMNFLCRPDAATLLAENDFARLWGFFTGMGGAPWLTETVRDRYRALWRHGLDGPLNYYRASPLRPPLAPSDALMTLQLAPESVTVQLATTVLWADADTALPPALLDGLSQWVPALDVRPVPQATHWLIHEQPALVAATIAELVRG
jgi:pimeloyl-ACP methyl ester carboxylesterase